MFTSRLNVGLACAFLTILCSVVPALAHDGGDPENLDLMALPVELQQNYAANWQQPLGPVFVQAADDYKVPKAILLTLGQMGSAFENRGGAPTIERGYGIMALRDNAWGGDSLNLAAQLTGASVEQLKLDPVANIRGAAAVLDSYARDLDVDRKAGLEAWQPVLARYAALDGECSQMFAAQVYQKIERGFALTNGLGENFTLAGAPVSPSTTAVLVQQPNQTEDYGGAADYLAGSCNYSTATHGSDTYVIHTIEGSATGCLSWFRNCNAQVSSNYVASEAGQIWRCVPEVYTAWTQGCYNSRSVSTEHEGYAASGSHPQSLYDASALCTRDVCDRRGIPKEKRTSGPGIIGHIDVTHCCCGSHTDPGNGWNWTYYINAVNGNLGPCGGTDHAIGIAESWPLDGDTVSTGQVFQKSWTVQNTGTATWTKACNFKWAFDGANQGLGTQSQFGTPSWTELGDNEAIAPGQYKVWTLTFTAPSTPGLYEADYRMDRYGTARFGVIDWILVNVVATNGNLTGTVTNASTSAPISGATVTLSGIGNTTTNGSGVYTFNSVAGGSYTVSVSATGYNPASDSATITAGNTTTKNFALTASDTQPPTTPTGLNATAPAFNSVQLTWTASTDNVGVAGYDIRRDGTIIGSSATASYTDNSVSQATTYTYEVRARDSVPNYSGWSAPAQVTTPYPPPASTVVFSDGFDGNMNNWAQGASAYDYSTTVSHGTFPGGGAAYMVAAQADQMYHSFARPFAQGKVRGYFYDGKGGWQASVCGWTYRQCISLRDADGAAKMYIDNEFYSASNNASYFYRLIGSGGVGHTAYATRDPGTDCSGAWIAFETSVAPGASGSSPPGTFTATVTDRAGSTSTTQNLTSDFFAWGFARINLGLGVSSANEGYWDDISLEATPPAAPTMNPATVLASNQIRWNFTPADNNHFGWDVADAAGTILSPIWPAAGWLDHNASSWTESGLTANTTYSRKVKSWNGTLNSYDSNVVSARTLSLAPSAGSVTPDNATPCAGSNVTWTAVGGFGAGKVEYYAYAWDTSPTHTFSGGESTWGSGTLSLAAATSGTWYLHVKGYNAADVANGTFDYSVTAANCAAPAVTAAVSRRTQGGNPFDINVAVATAVECRSGGPTQVVFTFDTAIEGLGGLDNADVSASSGSVDGVSITGAELTVTLSDVANAGKLVLTFPGIVAVGGNTASSGTVCFGAMTGDTTGDGTTNIFDLVTIRNNLNVAANASNFRSDVTADGTINIFDLVLARNNLNTSISGSCP